MAELISKLNINKKDGDKLYHSDINTMVSTINESINEINNRLTSFCNINIEELKSFSKEISLEEAINLVKAGRRVPGLIIKFLSSSTKDWVEYIFRPDKDNNSWFDLNNWKILGTPKLIDGGFF